MPLFKKFIQASAIILIASAGLTACGGGSNSGGGTAVVPPPPPPPPPPTGQGLELPAQLKTSLRENFTDAPDALRYSLTVTDTTLEPTNFRLEGADATNFELATTILSTSNQNVFDVDIRVRSTTAFDFEMPSDANADNTYNFDYIFDYGETTYSIPVEIDITNIREGTVIDGSLLRLDFQPTGVTKIPDVSSDNLPDAVLLGNDRFFDSGVYILSSQMIADTLGTFNVVTNDDLFTDFVPARRDGFERFTAKEAADGQGLDLLYSNTFADRYVYYDANTDAGWAFLEGDVDTDGSLNNGISYVRDDVNEVIDAQLIHDVNKDNQNDIFLNSQRTGELGLRWGAPRSGPTDNQRPGAFDVLFTNDDLAGVQPVRQFEIGTLPDIDGDGDEELIISNPLYLGGASNEGTGAIWVVNSSHLATSPSRLNLDDSNSPHVRRIVGTEGSLFGSSVTELEDANGRPIIVFGFGDTSRPNNDSGLIAIKVSDLQNLPQQATLSDLSSAGVSYVKGSDPAGAPTNGAIGPITAIADLDGDGLQDYLSAFSVLVMAKAILAGLEEAPGTEYVIDLDSALFLNRGSQFSSSNVIDLSEQGLVAFSQGTTDGEVLIAHVADLQQAIANPDGDISLRLP